MKLVGLTGSIAMGKSETLKMFTRLGCPVFDTDVAVHNLYVKGGAAVLPIAEKYPDAVVDGAIDREKLSRHVLKDASALQELEKIVHPLVHNEQTKFIENQRQNNAAIVVLDIPLLYEAHREDEFDCVVVVSTSPEVQHERAMERPGMTKAKLQKILSRQMPDSEKRRRADYVVDTGTGLDSAFDQVRCIVKTLNAKA